MESHNCQFVPVTNGILEIEFIEMKNWIALRRRDHPFTNGEPYQVGVGFQSELLHDAVFMKSNRARSEMQHIGGLLHGPAFREQMQNFALTGR